MIQTNEEWGSKWCTMYSTSLMYRNCRKGRRRPCSERSLALAWREMNGNPGFRDARGTRGPGDHAWPWRGMKRRVGGNRELRGKNATPSMLRAACRFPTLRSVVKTKQWILTWPMYHVMRLGFYLTVKSKTWSSARSGACPLQRDNCEPVETSVVKVTNFLLMFVRCQRRFWLLLQASTLWVCDLQ